MGVWNLRTGKLTAKLADSPLGAIVTHAVITPDGRYIISAESGNILIWHRLTERVVFKEEQPGIRQLTLMEDGAKVLAISKPSNPPGTDSVRTTATASVRTIPGERARAGAREGVLSGRLKRRGRDRLHVRVSGEERHRGAIQAGHRHLG